MKRLASICSDAVAILGLCVVVAIGFSRVVPDNLAAITAHGVSFWPVAALILIGSGGTVMLWSAVMVWMGTIAELRTSAER